ncbi:FKBP-type peptidyl-prolyl cis-trans isomerase [Rubrivirga sp.]|uniref:FKBP-type peptidyl-prolyl cis-trans isomerase n=1 Tax=Rubrivirga sp. TaxID=1885344 RepID=UPI003B52A63A
MRTLRLLPALLGLCALSGAPALTGCDSSGSSVVCPSADVFAFEDVTPADVTPGAEIRSGDCVAVEYVGRLADGGGVFAQGTDRRFVFPNGEPNIPRGFLLGMAGQRVGQTRLVTVPPDLAFGRQQIGAQAEGLVDIPSCSTVEFEIRLKSISQDARDCDR